MIATHRLYWTADRMRVVPESDPAAAVLYAAPGDEIDDAEAERLGVAVTPTDADVAEAAEATDAPQTKERPRATARRQ